jgi:hypothetical protein
MANDKPPPARTTIEPSDEEHRLQRYVCRISGGESNRRLGTGILIGPNRVLTCAHVLVEAANGQVVDDKVMQTIRCVFDDYDGSRGTTILSAIAQPPNHWSDVFEDDNAEDAPKPALDYAVFELVPREEGGDVGHQEITLKNGEAAERGWLELPDAGNFDTSLETKLISCPMINDTMVFAAAGKVIPVAAVSTRCHYTVDSDEGSSGGLVYQVRTDGSTLPLAMHTGRQATVQNRNSGETVTIKFGTFLRDISADFDPNGIVRTRTERKSSRLKLEIVIAEHGGAEQSRALLDDLHALFALDALSTQFDNLQYIPLIRSKEPSQIQLQDLCRLNRNNSFKQLDKVAEGDLVLMIASASDCADPKQRDLLTSAYGYLVARLGQPRVQLIYPENLPEGVEPLTNACFSDDEFVHLFEKSILDPVTGLLRVLETTRSPREDERGFFELALVALGNKFDDEILGNAHFFAQSSLHILGMRFGNLAERLDQIFTQFLNAKGKENATVTIAFPGAEVWAHNGGWREQILGGGLDTIQFLQAVNDRAKEGTYGESIMRRVQFVAINEIPTFILTAADLDTTWGKMLIAPAFKHSRASEASERKKPRLLVRNKLSQAGLFHAYRDALRGLFNPERIGADIQSTDLGGSVRNWTMAETSQMEEYIETLTKILSNGCEGSQGNTAGGKQ